MESGRRENKGVFGGQWNVKKLDGEGREKSGDKGWGRTDRLK